MARKPILNNLLVADILWISLHMEKEDVKSILEKTSIAHYEDESKRCLKNMVRNGLNQLFLVIT